MSEQESQDVTGRADQEVLETLLVTGTQYLKSSSIASVGAPEVFYNLPPRPHIGLRIDVTARQLREDQPNFEVSLAMQGMGYRVAPTPETPEPEILYKVDMIYSGLFAVQNARQELLETLLLIEAPRQLFPSARHLLLTLVREAGFPVANIQPVDFKALLQSRRAQS
ncbi:protein-export chaperone SecB [Asaia astilbis]|uniref:protein-export chaperone SecB n=1 Tax=Asaia astilbis TaxID=610244 RepID=UPI00046ECF68|nr:protein-export chaperone SecB [Asaia astilbis]